MTKQPDLKKHFEAILGRDIEIDGDLVVALRERLASYTIQEGLITSREIGTTGDSTKGCGNADLLDVSGMARTGDDGTTEFMLSEFFCDFSEGNNLQFQHPVNVVATPRSQTPITITITRSPTSGGSDVRIRVATWDPSGSPAPKISFDWRCRVPYEISIVIP